MAVSKRVEDVIAKGGAVKADSAEKKGFKIISQKVRNDVLDQVDVAVSERAGMNRSAWIQEAIQEKLKRLRDV